MNRFPSHFLDEIKARLRASDVIGRYVQLKKAGREWRGLSPFNKERTPSFFVNDEKAAFFDFSSGRSGDIFKFLMMSQNRTFPEAVEELASLAGLEIPQQTPEEEERLSEQEQLYKVLNDAAQFFRAQLRSDEGLEARRYLQHRQVTGESARDFELGYALQSWDGLKRYFAGRGVSEDVLLRAGLLKKRDDSGKTYDAFRHRVMFPIRDPRGRVVAFGGRALSSDAQAKYLNSAETEVFHKGRVLYNFARTRDKLKGDAPLLICEGYMDALALDAAGYAAVAPLGTALTEAQLRLLWRVERAPVLCFDGDRAGRGAAERALDRALPMISAKQSLRFVFLPEGEDPDDLLKRGGRPAFEALLATRSDPEETMWRLALARHGAKSAEAIASLETEIIERLQKITDGPMRSAMQKALKDRLYDLRGEQLRSKQQKNRVARERRAAPRAQLSEALRSKLGGQTAAGVRSAAREAQLVIALIHHPQIFHAHENEILELKLADEGLRKLLAKTIDAIISKPDLDSEELRSQLTGCTEAIGTYQRWSADPLVRIVRFTRRDANNEDASAGWRDAYLIDRHQKVLSAEVSEAGAEAHLDEGREKVWLNSVRLSLGAQSERETSDDSQ